jgi:hypothetical protein
MNIFKILKEKKKLFSINVFFEEFKYSLQKTHFISRIGFIYYSDFIIDTEKKIEFNNLNLINFIREKNNNSINKIIKINLNAQYFELFSTLISEIKFKYIIIVSNPININIKTLGFINIIADINCLRIYSTNLNYIHNKCFLIPLGLDYQCVWLDRYDWGADYIFPLHQEHELLDVIRHKSKPLNQRSKLIFCDYQFRIQRGDRERCLAETPKELCHFLPKRLPRIKLWKEMINHMFVLSPTGVGDDCFRTWESIILGCIPIIKKNYLSNLYKDFPVILVDDYSDISLDLLLLHVSKFQEIKYPFYKLSSKYWKSIINDQIISIPEINMTISEYQSYLIGNLDD